MSTIQETGNDLVVDLRGLSSRQRRAAVRRAWADLDEGCCALFLSDEDPLPLYHQFACENAGRFRWEYLPAEPGSWRVRIAKGMFAHPGFVPAQDAPSPLAPAAADPSHALTLDVRPLFARGETPCQLIDAAVARLAPGQALVLLVPFEPLPLLKKLSQAGFSSQSERLADGTWRIEFRPTA
jgi:uncharacterized protein (DUF2249 family)